MQTGHQRTTRTQTGRFQGLLRGGGFPAARARRVTDSRVRKDFSCSEGYLRWFSAVCVEVDPGCIQSDSAQKDNVPAPLHKAFPANLMGHFFLAKLGDSLRWVGLTVWQHGCLHRNADEHPNTHQHASMAHSDGPTLFEFYSSGTPGKTLPP